MRIKKVMEIGQVDFSNDNSFSLIDITDSIINSQPKINIK